MRCCLSRNPVAIDIWAHRGLPIRPLSARNDDANRRLPAASLPAQAPEPALIVILGYSSLALGEFASGDNRPYRIEARGADATRSTRSGFGADPNTGEPYAESCESDRQIIHQTVNVMSDVTIVATGLGFPEGPMVYNRVVVSCAACSHSSHQSGLWPGRSGFRFAAYDRLKPECSLFVCVKPRCQTSRCNPVELSPAGRGTRVPDLHTLIDLSMGRVSHVSGNVR
jgi:hypothetical protein